MMGDNPYLGVGQVARGDRFVGRVDKLAELLAYVGRSGRPGNVSVQGNHRMGKTSLVERAISELATRWPDLVCIRLSVGVHTSGTALFRALTSAMVNTVRRRGQDGAILLKSIEPWATAAHEADDWFDFSERLKAFFQIVNDFGVSVWVVLDEFDHAGKVFSSLGEFQLLRDLASGGESSIGLVTVSRQAIAKIEYSSFGGSTLEGVLPNRVYAMPFTATEVAEMVGRSGQSAADIRPLSDDIFWWSGGHPFMAELMCCSLVEASRSGRATHIETARRALAPQLNELFRRMMDCLEHDASGRAWDILFQLYSHQPLDLSHDEIDLVVRQGIAQKEERKPAVLFCSEFQNFLAGRLPSSDAWWLSRCRQLNGPLEVMGADPMPDVLATFDSVSREWKGQRAGIPLNYDQWVHVVSLVREARRRWEQGELIDPADREIIRRSVRLLTDGVARE